LAVAHNMLTVQLVSCSEWCALREVVFMYSAPLATEL
jgi:hypothetical protein